MRNGCIIQTSTSVDIHETVNIDGKVIEIYEGVIYRDNFKVNPFRKIIDNLFALGQKYKDKNNEVMQFLVYFSMNTLYGEILRQDILESYECKSEAWMLSESDERVLDYRKIIHGNYIVKLRDDDGLQDEVKRVNILPLQLAAFILSSSKKIMNNFIHAINGFYTNDVYYSDTESF